MSSARTGTTAKIESKLKAQMQTTTVVNDATKSLAQTTASLTADDSFPEKLLESYNSYMSNLSHQNPYHTFAPQHQADNHELDRMLKDYVIIDDVDSNAPYDVFVLQSLLALLAKKNEFKKESEYHDDKLGAVLSIYQKDNKRIALFDVVKDTDDNIAMTGNALTPLKAALNYFKEHRLSADILIVPVACLTRNHYRLLEINLSTHTAAYYDSKSTLIRAGSAAPAAVIEAYMVINKIDVPSENANFSAASAADPQVETIDKVLLTKAQLWLAKAKEAWDIFYKSYHYVNHACLAVFEGVQTEAVSLGHQGVFNHVDCGVHLAEYVNLTFQNKPKHDTPRGADVLRLIHQEILSGQSCDYEYQSGMSAQHRFR
jgi:hypothetical protein